MIKIGILGLANIARKAIIPAIQSLNETFVLAGIATESKEKLKVIEKEYKVTSFATYQDLINETSIDAVYIPLPNSLHYEWVKKALLSGKHVLVEKSLACKLEEVIELNEIAKHNNLVLLESFQFRFHSQLEYIKTTVNEGTIGEIRYIRSSFAFPPFSDKNNIRYNKSLGGGALFDVGAYPIKLAQELLGNNLKLVYGHLDAQNNEVDLLGSGALIDLNSNIPFQFAFGFDHYYQCNVEILGTKGKIYTNRIFSPPIDYAPEIRIELNSSNELVVIEPFNAYAAILKYFSRLMENQNLREQEYLANEYQSKLISNFIKIANDAS